MHYVQLSSRRSSWYRQFFFSYSMSKHTGDFNWQHFSIEITRIIFIDRKWSPGKEICAQIQCSFFCTWMKTSKKKFNWMINTDHSPQTQRLMTPKGIIMRATRRQAMLPSGVTNCYHRLLSMRIFFFWVTAIRQSSFSNWICKQESE